MTSTPATNTEGPLAARPVDVTVSFEMADDAFGIVSLAQADPQWIRTVLDVYADRTDAIVSGFAFIASINVTACRGNGRPSVVSVVPPGDDDGAELGPAYAAACRGLRDELIELIEEGPTNWIAALQTADARHGLQPLC